MAVKKQRKKAYKPKSVDRLGGMNVISSRMARSNPLPANHQNEVIISYYHAIDAMTGGYAEVEHFDALVYAANIGNILAEIGIGNEYKEMFLPVIAGLRKCKERHQKSGKFGLDGETFVALCKMADLHEAQIKIATTGELEAAIKEMHRRVKKTEDFA